jgi:anti-sigma regulatory factor (Ser/Thr protein kinase)
METRTPTGTDATTFERSYPGTAEQIRRVRADLSEVLDGCPAADDLRLVVSELCTNAALHSRSRDRGGRFIVRVDVRPDDYVWAEVDDQGGPWLDPGHDDRPHGLSIVAALAGDGNWGVDGDEATGHTVWVRLDWKDQR